MKRKCPVCNSTIQGRLDKKYCSDQCRYVENNKAKNEKERTILDINRSLRRNRAILKTLCPAGKTVVRRELLTSMGYDLTAFTSIYVTTGKQVYYLCYDYAFSPLLEKGVEKALIVARQDYMNKWDPWKFVKRSTSESVTEQAKS